MERLILIIPARNEEKRISKTLDNYWQFLKEKKNKKEIKDFEILIIINNSKDKTEEIVKEYSRNFPEIRYVAFKEGGKGFAIIEGFKESLKGNFGLIGFVDADMSTPPDAFYELVRNIKDYDGVIANRWVKESIMTPRQSLARRIISKLITINWGFDIALLYCFKKESHARIKSIPTVWHDKAGSKINITKTPLRTLMSTIRLRLIHSPFRFIVRFYRKLPKKWQVHNPL